MGGSCQHKALCSCSNASEITDYVKDKIESCIQNFMSLEETVNYLQENYQISHYLTNSSWEQLQRESPDFFKNYNLNCTTARQIKMFNDMLAKQVAQMIELGDLDIFDSSPAIMAFLDRHPEGIRLLNKLANTSCYKKMESSASLAVTQFQIPPHDQQNQFHPYQRSTSNDYAYNHLEAPTLAPAATCPTALMQLQIPNDQQNQLHPYPCSTFIDYDYIGAPTVATAATDRWGTSDYPSYNHHGAPTAAPADTDHWSTSTDPALVTQLQISNGQQNQLHHDPRSRFSDLDCDDYLGDPTTDHWGTSTDPADVLADPTFAPAPFDKWSSSNEFAYIGAQPVAQAATTLDHPSTFGFGGDSGYNGQSFQDKELDVQAHDLMQSDEQLKDRSGQHQPQFQLQQNFQLQVQQTLPCGESIDQQQLWNSFDTDQSTRAYTSVDQQQARGVKRHHPESEALNINPDSGDGTLNSMISKGNNSNDKVPEREDQYQSEETKEIYKQ